MTVQIMIVEDDLELRDQYRTLIQGRNTLSLAAETDSVEEALRILQMMEIDAMILDLELPGGSEILLLEELKKLQIPKPFISVVTNVVSKPVYQTIRMLGADYICAKGERGFSLNVPISIIEISAPYQKKAGASTVTQDEISRQKRIDIYKRRIEDELLRLGFSSYSTRYHKLLDIGGTVGLFVFNLLIGGVIGGVILVGRLFMAGFYLMKIIAVSICRLVKAKTV